MIDSIFLNGTVGVGKTTVADTLSDIEVEKGNAHAVIDLDHIRRAWPAPREDRFSHELELANLRDLVSNYRAAGVQHFVLAGVIEQSSEVPRYERALLGTGMLICRLEADAAVVAERLSGRHEEGSEQLAWHLTRAQELAAILRKESLDGLVLDASRETPRQLAEAVSRAAGWG